MPGETMLCSNPIYSEPLEARMPRMSLDIQKCRNHPPVQKEERKQSLLSHGISRHHSRLSQSKFIVAGGARSGILVMDKLSCKCKVLASSCTILGRAILVYCLVVLVVPRNG
jgi:hypothetical protein